MGKMQRVKGATFERFYARVLQGAGVAAKRGIGQARAAAEVADVDVAGWWHELKHGVAPSWRAALAQAKEALRQRAKKGITEEARAPLIVTRDNNGPVVIHLELEHFLPLFVMWEQATVEQRRHAREASAKGIASASSKKRSG